jgi:hypothetical protein
MALPRFERFLPLAGALAAVIFVVAMVLTGDKPTVGDDGVAKVVAWFEDHETAAAVSGFGAGYVCLLLLMFGSALRAALRPADGTESGYANVAYAGTIVVALALALSGVLTLAGFEAADDGNASAVGAVGFIDDFAWMPWVAGSAAMLLGTGLGALRTLVLPKWLAIVSIVLGVLCLLGPGGILVFFATPLWLLAVSVLLYRRQAVATPAVTPRDTAVAA